MGLRVTIEVALTLIVLTISIWKTFRVILWLSKDKLLYPMILQFITEAEATHKNGPEKLSYVLDNIGAYAKEQGLELDLDYIKDLIERIIIMTKKVNVSG